MYVQVILNSSSLVNRQTGRYLIIYFVMILIDICNNVEEVYRISHYKCYMPSVSK